MGGCVVLTEPPVDHVSLGSYSDLAGAVTQVAVTVTVHDIVMSVGLTSTALSLMWSHVGSGRWLVSRSQTASSPPFIYTDVM